jgi:hypothetical protein
VSGVSLDKLLVMQGKANNITEVHNPDTVIKRLVDAGYVEVIDSTAEEFKELPSAGS